MSGAPEAIYIHIGHGKTGSSFLQSALALSTEALERNGFVYPIDEDTAEKARAGQITGGNLYAPKASDEDILRMARQAAGRKLLISGESMFSFFARPKRKFLNNLPELLPGVPLYVICYLRDPVDHAVSAYHQRIKRGGYTGTLADHLTTHSHPERTTAALTALKALGAKVTVLNYSRHRDDLLDTFGAWLGLPEGSLTAPERGEVNRSLTLSELELQRLFNQRLGKLAARLVSNPLCNQVPELRSETPPLARADLEQFLDRMQREMSDPAYQALVPEAERPWVGTIEDHADRFTDPAEASTQYSFNQRQLDVLTDTLAAYLTGQAALLPKQRNRKKGTTQRKRKGAGKGGRKRAGAKA